MKRNIKMKDAKKALLAVAQKEGVTLEEVREEISKAIMIAMETGDESAQAMWKECPCEGEVPTPEEVIMFISNKLK